MKEEDLILEMVLNEERGVAAFKYKDVIDEIYAYIQNKVKERFFYLYDFMKNYHADNFKLYKQCSEINIPQEITSKIDFINDLKIIIILEPETKSDFLNNDYGEGSYFTGVDMDGKISRASIGIKCKHKGEEILTRSFYNNMYHELNHIYQAWKQFNKGVDYAIKKFPYFDEPKSDYQKYYNYFYQKVFSDIEDGTTKETACEFISTCMYRLFNKSEVNSLVSGVYGDLKQYYPDYDKTPNFQETVYKTQAYSVYQELSRKKETFLSCITNENFQKIKEYLLFFKNEPNASSYRKRLRMFINDRLKNFLKNIGRAASLYYNEMEDRNDLKLFKMG